MRRLGLLQRQVPSDIRRQLMPRAYANLRHGSSAFSPEQGSGSNSNKGELASTLMAPGCQ